MPTNMWRDIGHLHPINIVVPLPLQMSATDGKYHNYFGEFSEDSLIKDGSYEFGISECRSGLFHLEGLSQEKVPAAKHLQIICPHHCQHELEAINRNTLICNQYDPRLAHIEGAFLLSNK